MVAPALLVHRYVELRPADEVAVSLLFMLTAAAAYVLGRVMAALEHLDGDRSVPADPRLHSVTPPPPRAMRSWARQVTPTPPAPATRYDSGPEDES